MSDSFDDVAAGNERYVRTHRRLASAVPARGLARSRALVAVEDQADACGRRVTEVERRRTPSVTAERVGMVDESRSIDDGEGGGHVR